MVSQMRRRFPIRLWIPFAAVLVATGAAFAQTGEIPSLAASIRVEGPISFSGEPVPLDDPDVRERLEKELLISLWDRPQVVLWLKRSTRYFPVIEPMLEAGGIPDDFKYLALAESALRAHAGSPKGAMGYWQFMPATARKHGLRVDRYKDERRNVFRSTEAAVRYLGELRGQFGSWALAAAAYNMGEEGLASEILAQGVEDYYRLYLPLETQRYLFRVLSVKLILEDPERFGFVLEEGDYYPPTPFERLRFDSLQEAPLALVAKAAGTDFKRIKDLNPELRGHYLEPGRHEILVPPGAGDGFEERFASSLAAWSRDREDRVYVVQPGDSLSTIAQRFEVPIQALLIWNRIDLKKPIHPGDRLVVHRRD